MRSLLDLPCGFGLRSPEKRERLGVGWPIVPGVGGIVMGVGGILTSVTPCPFLPPSSPSCASLPGGLEAGARAATVEGRGTVLVESPTPTFRSHQPPIVAPTLVEGGGGLYTRNTVPSSSQITRLSNKRGASAKLSRRLSFLNG